MSLKVRFGHLFRAHAHAHTYPDSMLMLAQLRHWFATSPLEFQRRANVRFCRNYDVARWADVGHPRKSIFVFLVLFSP